MRVRVNLDGPVDLVLDMYSTNSTEPFNDGIVKKLQAGAPVDRCLVPVLHVPFTYYPLHHQLDTASRSKRFSPEKSPQCKELSTQLSASENAKKILGFGPVVDNVEVVT